MNEPRPTSQYIHGTDPGEQRRLALMNDLLNERCLAQLGPRSGERVLDVGSGPGQFTHAIAKAVGPSGKVVGIERNAVQLGQALAITPALAEFRTGDAYALPLADAEWGTFDLIHSRFLLEHLGDPLAAVRQMVKAGRPGGRIVLEDDDHAQLRLEPPPPGFSTLWTAYERAFDRLGNDPFIGRRLVSLLHQAGARPARASVIPWSNCAGHAEFPDLMLNLIEVIRTAREQIVNGHLLTGPDFDAGLEEIERWSKRPDAVFWYSISWAEAVIPA